MMANNLAKDSRAGCPIFHFLSGKRSGPNVEISELTTMPRTISSINGTPSNISVFEKVIWNPLQVDVVIIVVNYGIHAVLN